VCRLICVTIWCPYSTTNEGEVWALQRTTKPEGLRMSVLTIRLLKKEKKEKKIISIDMFLHLKLIKLNKLLINLEEV